jgi:uroporphyrinogen III methyltransferase/synthase
MSVLEVFVDIEAVPISAFSSRILTNVAAYDHVVFTSKNAERIFVKTLHARRIDVPAAKFIRVGPRADLLRLGLSGKRVLFPRSKLAPFDVVRKLRAQGAVVQPLILYTARGRRLSASQMKKLLAGEWDRLYFKSPSGVAGLLRQFTKADRRVLKGIPALCIGQTTSAAAKKAGWKKISVKRVV